VVLVHNDRRFGHYWVVSLLDALRLERRGFAHRSVTPAAVTQCMTSTARRTNSPIPAMTKYGVGSMKRKSAGSITPLHAHAALF
jgi:hypothetical protein